MNIRQEVEKTITEFVANRGFPVAFEGVPFNKPAGSSWLEVIFLSPSVINPTVDAEAVRKRGTIQINCYTVDGKGMRALDDLTEQIVSLFPAYDKPRFKTFSVEQTPSTSSALIDGIFRCAAVRVKYRQEL